MRREATRRTRSHGFTVGFDPWVNRNCHKRFVTMMCICNKCFESLPLDKHVSLHTQEVAIQRFQC